MIECKDLLKTYNIGKNKIYAVSIKNLELNRNNFYSIVGPSGAGKSTLLHLICGIEKPDKGKIKINDTIVSELSSTKSSSFRLKKTGIIFQQDYLIKELTVYENLKLIKELANIKGDFTKIDKLLSFLGLYKYKNQYPRFMSGGERQRLSFARALLFDPEIIIADEPTSNLDSENAKMIFSFLKKIADNNKIVITATHNQLVKKYADKIIYIKDGKLDRNENKNS